ncbi:MAG TPA: hypothetical protein VGE04_12280, partial [Chloroflexia bacterium]
GATVLVLFPFLIVGLWLCWRHPGNGGMLLVFITGTMLIGLLFWADTRIRAPAEPFIVLIAAVGAERLVRRERAARTLRSAAQMTTPGPEK